MFRQCVAALYMVKDQHPQAVKEATASVLPEWLEAFKVLLNIDPQQEVANPENWDALAIRIQIFKVSMHSSHPGTFGLCMLYSSHCVDSGYRPYFVPAPHDILPQRLLICVSAPLTSSPPHLHPFLSQLFVPSRIIRGRACRDPASHLPAYGFRV